MKICSLSGIFLHENLISYLRKYEKLLTKISILRCSFITSDGGGGMKMFHIILFVDESNNIIRNRLEAYQQNLY